MIDDIPGELKSYAQWIVWRYESRDDKETKVPYDPKTGSFAAVDDPTTWTDFATAVIAVGTGNYSGLGFVLTEGDPFSFIDLDIKPNTTPDQVSQMIRVQETFDTYSERSPGGLGLHLICMGHVPRGRKRSGIEVYSSLRYMTVTGDVYDRKPIAERQAYLNILWAEMGVGTHVYNNAGEDAPQIAEDQEILNRASGAANGSKFVALYQGEWQKLYPSQSEADFALIDMVAYYTQNREQIERLFKVSALGQRKKANRIDYLSSMVNRSFDRMLPLVNIDGMKARWDAITTGVKTNGAGAMLGGLGAWGYAAPFVSGEESPQTLNLAGQATVYVNDHSHSVNFPPGLMGELATYFYQSAQRPVAEMGLAAAIGLVSGICGRAYNTNTHTGLNLYTVLIAESGTGKEAMASGISRITEAIAKFHTGMVPSVPAIREFVGPSDFRSDIAIIKAVERQPSMVSILGEFGFKLRQWYSPKASHLAGIKGHLLDLYHKSGAGDVYRPVVYSDKEKNTKEIHSPAFSLLGESTPSAFYDSIDESMIEHGLIQRFLIIEYTGIRVPSNEMLVNPSQELLTRVGTIAGYALTMMHSNRVIEVQFSNQQVKDMAKAFDQFADRSINANTIQLTRELWNRAHLKTLRLAGCVAVGIDPYTPLITPEVWVWAQQLVERDIHAMIKRFDKGEMGLPDINEQKQHKEILRLMREYLMTPWNVIAPKYNLKSEAMHRAYVIPREYLSRRVQSLGAFKRERFKTPTEILDRALKQLMDSGIVSEVTSKAKFDLGGKSYMLDSRYANPEE